MKKHQITICFVAVLSVLIMNVLIPSAASCLGPVERKSLIASLPRGDVFENDGENYVWLPTLRGEKTIAGKAATRIKQKADAATEDTADVEQKGPFRIYKPSATSGKLYARSVKNSSICPIALNLRTKSLAIVTGNIWLKLKNIHDADAIAVEYGLSLSFSNAAMSTSFYQVPAEMDIQTLRTQLLADSRIMRVTLDMVDRIRHPR